MLDLSDSWFQYPEGFWPDSDKRILQSNGIVEARKYASFSTPKGFGPIVTKDGELKKVEIVQETNPGVSVPRRVLAR